MTLLNLLEGLYGQVEGIVEGRLSYANSVHSFFQSSDVLLWISWWCRETTHTQYICITEQMTWGLKKNKKNQKTNTGTGTLMLI